MAIHFKNGISVYSDVEGSSYDVGNQLSWIWEDINSLWANICFQEGTQILMADGTYKNIEDVNYGDMIMTWDTENQCTIPCKSFGKLFTGYTPGWEILCFDNGSILKIYQTHRVYNVTKGYLMPSKEWVIGHKGIASNGQETAYCYHPKKIPAAVASRKFTLFSETGMFFANDILCGHPISQPLDIYNRTRHGIPLTEEEIADMTEYAKARDDYYVVEVQNTEYLKEALPFRRVEEKANLKIAKYKADLASRDYKTIKAMQGKLTEEEYLDNIAACEELRAKIGEKELILAENEAEIKALQEKYGIQTKYVQDIENECILKAIAKARAKYCN